MKSVLIIGMGRFGRHLAHKMLELGNDVMVVDENEEIIQQMASTYTDSFIGDCTNESVVRSLGVNNYDLCFVTIGDNFQSSLIITSLLKTFGAKYVVAKAKQDIQAELLKKIGADEIVYPEKEIAEKLAIRHNANNIFDYIELTDEFAIYEIPLPIEWIDKTVGIVDVRRKYKVNIIAVKNDNTVHVLPGADYVFKINDHLMVIGKSTDVFKIAAKQ